MTPAHFRTIRQAAGLSLSAIAELLGIEDRSTVHRWEKGARAISGPVTRLMRLLDRDGADAVRSLSHE